MNFHFVFVHGWGAAPDFWKGLIKCLPGIKASKIDLGFIGGQENIAEQPHDAVIHDTAIYVTHSLGTMWALKNRHANMKALITINGFPCFKNFTDERVLQVMKKRLKRNPGAQMKEFWQGGGLPFHENFNIEKLQTGLEWLTSWDANQELKGLKCPVLSLAGQSDPILPISIMQQEWEGHALQICDGAGHALPLSHSQWCAERIKDFVCNV